MLKVLHFVSRMDRAGQETFIMNLFRVIDREKIQFNFLCSRRGEGDYDSEIRALGGQIFYTSEITARGPAKQIQKFRVLKKALRQHPCDVYHIHTHHAMDAFRDALAAKSSGIPIVVVHSHNTSALYHIGAHKVFRYLLALLPIRRFACSEAAGHWMFLRNNFRVIHNGLNLDDLYFQPESRARVRDEMGWNGQKIIGHVGRFNEQKNHRFLINVFEKIHKMDQTTRLVLVGQGELESEIRSLVQEKGLEDAVNFLGVRSDAQILYQGMDLLLFPSLFEGLSVVLVEAQACDLPCLVSDTNSSETAITNRLTMLSLKEPPEIWAQKALKLLYASKPREDNREVLRKAGYDIRTLAVNLEKIYKGQ